MNPHTRYLSFLYDTMGRWRKRPRCRKHLARYASELLRMALLDLTPAQERLQTLYATKTRGQAPAEPTCVLRSLMLMRNRGVTSVTAWVEELKHNRYLAALTGFQAYHQALPEVGTYYRFFARLMDGAPGRYPKGQAPSELRKRSTLRPPHRTRKQQRLQLKEELDQRGLTQS